MKDYEEFFKSMEDYRIETRFYENGGSFEVEELYQAFKARLIDELVADIKDCSAFANLTERDDQG